MSFFELGGIKVPLNAALGFQQTYNALRQPSDNSYANGSPVMLHSNLASKLETTLSGTGWVGLGLSGLDLHQLQELKCGRPRPIDNITNTIVIPAARRSDAGYEPLGYAMMANGDLVSTTINVVTNTATLGVVAGAVQYRVDYFPQFQAKITQWPSEDADMSSVNYSWTFKARQA